MNLLNITKQPKSDKTYPITGAAEVKVSIELNLSKLTLQTPLKLNIGTGTY